MMADSSVQTETAESLTVGESSQKTPERSLLDTLEKLADGIEELTRWAKESIIKGYSPDPGRAHSPFEKESSTPENRTVAIAVVDANSTESAPQSSRIDNSAPATEVSHQPGPPKREGLTWPPKLKDPDLRGLGYNDNVPPDLIPWHESLKPTAENTLKLKEQFMSHFQGHRPPVLISSQDMEPPGSPSFGISPLKSNAKTGEQRQRRGILMKLAGKRIKEAWPESLIVLSEFRYPAITELPFECYTWSGRRLQCPSIFEGPSWEPEFVRIWYV